MSSKVRYLTLTALMLALCVVFQFIRVLIPALNALSIFGPFTVSSLIIGSLVNLTLIIAAWRVGFWSGITIALLSTVIAFFQGHLPLVHMMPVVAVGNAVIVTVVWLLRKANPLLTVFFGAVLKFLALWSMVMWIVVPILTPVEGMGPKINAISVMFAWPQLVTGLVGGALACLLWPRLKKAARG